MASDHANYSQLESSEMTKKDQIIEAMARAMWAALVGVTHDGSEPWDSVGMRRYAGTSNTREHIISLARAAYRALQEREAGK